MQGVLESLVPPLKWAGIGTGWQWRLYGDEGNTPGRFALYVRVWGVIDEMNSLCT